MSLDCTINGQVILMRGLLASATLDVALRYQEVPLFSGVPLIFDDDGNALLAGPITLNDEEVAVIVQEMRRQLLDGQLHSYRAWAQSYGHSEPLTFTQDIERFRDDANTFADLASWLASSRDSEELFFA